jgi:hypothetical protein
MPFMMKLLLLIAIAHTMLALTLGCLLDLNRRAGGGRGGGKLQPLLRFPSPAAPHFPIFE